MNNPEFEEFLISTERTNIFLRMEVFGEDILLKLFGSGSHIGAVITCIPSENEIITNVSVTGNHKEDVVARPLAETVCSITGKKTVCISGIHIDNASKKDIEDVIKAVDDLRIHIKKFFENTIT